MFLLPILPDLLQAVTLSNLYSEIVRVYQTAMCRYKSHQKKKKSFGRIRILKQNVKKIFFLSARSLPLFNYI